MSVKIARMTPQASTVQSAPIATVFSNASAAKRSLTSARSFSVISRRNHRVMRRQSPTRSVAAASIGASAAALVRRMASQQALRSASPRTSCPIASRIASSQALMADASPFTSASAPDGESLPAIELASQRSSDASSRLLAHAGGSASVRGGANDGELSIFVCMRDDARAVEGKVPQNGPTRPLGGHDPR